MTAFDSFLLGLKSVILELDSEELEGIEGEAIVVDPSWGG